LRRAASLAFKILKVIRLSYGSRRSNKIGPQCVDSG
jgi:hypothetical protein